MLSDHQLAGQVRLFDALKTFLYFTFIFHNILFFLLTFKGMNKLKITIKETIKVTIKVTIKITIKVTIKVTIKSIN